MYRGQDLSKSDLKCISKAFDLIEEVTSVKVDLGYGMIMY